MDRIECVELYPALMKWAKQRRYKINCVGRDVYKVTKRGFVLMTIILKGDDITLKYDNVEEKSCHKVFLKYLNEEIEQRKFSEKLKRQAKPAHTFPPKMCRQKMSWIGPNAMREKGHQMNRRFLGIPYKKE